MKIIEVQSLAIPEVRLIRFSRFPDSRGYFTESFRAEDFRRHPALDFLQDVQFVQANESFSLPGTVRGLHFQWNPYMGKLVRTLSGRMVDLVMDIRKGSLTCGKIIAVDMPSRPEMDYGEWIWVPVGFAHGNFFDQSTMIEYFCSGQYSPGCEAGISPVAPDLDWSLCDPALRAQFNQIAGSPGLRISDKDLQSLTLAQWLEDERSDQFIAGQC